MAIADLEKQVWRSSLINYLRGIAAFATRVTCGFL
jgi:hypothetical protein